MAKRKAKSKRAGHRQGWSSSTYQCRGVEVKRPYKPFLATSRLISGEIRVVIIRFEDGGWAPYFCTDTSAKVGDILETVAARWAIEEPLYHVKAARCERSVGSGSATSAQCVVEPGLLAFEPMDVHVGRVMLLGHGQVGIE
jgi:hypothetical protein